MTFGLQCDEPSSVAIPDRAAAGGITLLDTSGVYPIGGTLETVGRTEEISKHILDAIDASLRRLRTDYVDLYQLHHPDPTTPIDESLRALDDVIRAGKARYVGCSNYFAHQVARALGRGELLGLARLGAARRADPGVWLGRRHPLTASRTPRLVAPAQPSVMGEGNAWGASSASTNTSSNRGSMSRSSSKRSVTPKPVVCFGSPGSSRTTS
jgi:hypothetical protein